MMTDAVRALLEESVDRHLAFVDEVSRADVFETLPAWVQKVILDGEQQPVAFPGTTYRTPADNP